MNDIRQIGKHSYYADPIQIFTYGKNPDRYVEIGRCTSISFNCRILLNDGDHYYKTGTTCAFPLKRFDKSISRFRNYPSRGNVIIGNDVWIGHDVTIMSGVTIGDGAIVATNSHVVKDVAPYSIYGGNPAKFIKYRFDKEIIDKFLEIQWWKYSDNDINSILPYLQQEPSLELVDKIKSLLVNGTIDNSNICTWHEIQKLHISILKRPAIAENMWKYFLSEKTLDQLRLDFTQGRL